MNRFLLKNLDKALGVKKKTIYENAHVTQTSYHRWIQNGDLPLVALVKVCNGMHIAIGHFFIDDRVEYRLVNKWDYEIGRNFNSIEIRLKALLDDIMTLKGLSKQELMTMLDCTPYELAVWFKDNGKSTLSVNKYLELMNMFKVWPGAYVVDSNRDIECKRNYSKKMISEAQMLREKVKELEERIRVLEAKVRGEG